MTANTNLNPGSGGDVIATDDLSGYKAQRVKLILGATGVDGGNVTPSNPFPVSQNLNSKLTYTAAINRLSTGALTANTSKEILSMEVAAGGTKTIKLLGLFLTGYATSAVAGTVEFQFWRGATASTSGTVVTSAPMNPGQGAASAVVKSLPACNAVTLLDQAAGQSVPATANSSFGVVNIAQWTTNMDAQPFILRPGNVDTFSWWVLSTAAITLTFSGALKWTEE